MAFSHARWSNKRSVMPIDVRGCTGAIMGGSASVYPAPRGAGNPLNLACDRDWGFTMRAKLQGPFRALPGPETHHPGGVESAPTPLTLVVGHDES